MDRMDFEDMKRHAERRLAAELGIALFEQCGVSSEKNINDPDPFRPAWRRPGEGTFPHIELKVEILAMRRKLVGEIEKPKEVEGG